MALDQGEPRTTADKPREDTINVLRTVYEGYSLMFEEPAPGEDVISLDLIPEADRSARKARLETAINTVEGLIAGNPQLRSPRSLLGYCLSRWVLDGYKVGIRFTTVIGLRFFSSVIQKGALSVETAIEESTEAFNTLKVQLETGESSNWK